MSAKTPPRSTGIGRGTFLMNEKPIVVGSKVSKVGGDYRFDGTVVAVFVKLDSVNVRYVVEDDRGVLHIYSAKNLRFSE